VEETVSSVAVDIDETFEEETKEVGVRVVVDIIAVCAKGASVVLTVTDARPGDDCTNLDFASEGLVMASVLNSNV
jgi:hypothetical protein